MDRRVFLKRLGLAVAGSTVAYSFPSIIVPKNIEKIVLAVSDSSNYSFGFTGYEIYPKLIEDNWFQETPLFARLRGNCDIQDMTSRIYAEINGVYRPKFSVNTREVIEPLKGEMVLKFDDRLVFRE